MKTFDYSEKATKPKFFRYKSVLKIDRTWSNEAKSVEIGMSGIMNLIRLTSDIYVVTDYEQEKSIYKDVETNIFG